MMADSEPDLDHDVVIRRLIETLPCSACGGHYGPQDVYVIEQDADAWTLVAFCPDCGAESLVKAYVADEAADPLALPPDIDEVLDWRNFLVQFQGDLRDLMC